MWVILTMYLNQFRVRLYQTYKNLLEKVKIVLLIKLFITIHISKYKRSSRVSFIKLQKNWSNQKKFCLIIRILIIINP